MDLRAYRPAGGPVMLQLLEMPAQPKSHTNNWTVRKSQSESERVTKTSAVALFLIQLLC